MRNIEVISNEAWVYYLNGNADSLDESICGKWMYFFNDVDFASEICRKAVAADVCPESKHSNSEDGVCCFYVNGNDIEAHKKVIKYFLDNKLIRKTKTGKLYNISFKFDSQTDNGEYGMEYASDIKLDTFVDLFTGEFKDI